MASKVELFDLEGKTVLGFDTGLNAQAFAQAKLASFITDQGRIVFPDGRVEPWVPGGVTERNGTMVIWGPAFSGEPLDLLAARQEDEALDTLRRWIGAWPVAAENGSPPWPAAALVTLSERGDYPCGTILFPPSRLVKRCIEAEGPEAWRTRGEQWGHPDLKGEEAAAFTAGALLYRILTGTEPFPRQDVDLLRQDIREGVFLPPGLALPGLETPTVEIITGALAPIPKTPGGGKRPSLEDLGKFLGEPGSRKADSWVRSLDNTERAALEQERERFTRRKDLTVNTRRFVIRNTAIIGALGLVLLIAGLITQSILKTRSELPTTRGMSPTEVVSTYYGAFGDLDHQLMEACVTGKAGKDDINMVTNFFVMSRVRMAYEFGEGAYIPAQRWLDAGSPEISATIFGATDLRIQTAEGNPESGELWFRVQYRLWIPESALETADEIPDLNEAPPAGSRAVSLTDTLKLTLRKDAWRIAEIHRDNEDYR